MINTSFLEYLASARSDADFARAAAGFKILQIYDSVKTNGVSSFHVESLRKIESDLAHIDATPGHRDALAALTCVLPFWDSERRARIGRKATYTALLMYGTALGSDGEWAMAASVLALAAADTELDGESALSADARLLLGRAYRMCAEWEKAETAYHRAYQLARPAGLTAITIRAQIGEANLIGSRGNLQEAQRRLTKLSREARRLCPTLAPRVTLALAGIVNMGGEYERAISLAFGILDKVDDDEELKYQTLVDMASFLTDYGLPSVASAALSVVQKTAPDKHVRVHATINLYFLAATHGDAATFDTLRAELADERLTHRQRAQYALFTAQGCRRFGRFSEAKQSAEDAIRIANEYQHFQIAFEAETELNDIARAADSAAVTATGNVVPEPTTTSPAWDSVPPDIRRVARSLDTMAAGIGADMDTALTSAHPWRRWGGLHMIEDPRDSL